MFGVKSAQGEDLHLLDTSGRRVQAILGDGGITSIGFYKIMVFLQFSLLKDCPQGQERS
jgi:hypothetical protein